MHSRADIAKRAKAAAEYRPRKVRLLLVAEAPPCDTSRYFYFSDVPNHDWLYVYVCRGFFGGVEIADLRARKGEYLGALRDNGVWMIDVAQDGMKNPTLTQLKPLVAALVARCKAIKPEAIVLIKSSVYDAAFAALREARLPVVDVRMPFPASGQQPAFLRLFADALEETGIRVPLARPRDGIRA
ncbi:MAG: hypothetical protein KF805_14630 [Phycisphaeraceae bacterium]|nr:hypothetical protein [Phycisphaeraceae bacterium]